MSFTSQIGQDKFVVEYFKGKKNGIFIDIGAHDGVTYSNTYYLEKELGWTGLCVEPIPEVFQKLSANRTAICVNCCASDQDGKASAFLQLTGYTEMLSGLVHSYDPRHLDRIESELKSQGGTQKIINVQQRTLTKLCLEHNLIHVDYLSIDTEGSELQVLKGLDLDRIAVTLINIEDNYPDKFAPINTYLENYGYFFLKRISHDVFYHKPALNR